MNAQQIQDDLRGDFRGQLQSSRATLNSYSADSSLFSLRPKLVAAPQDEQDLVVLVRYCHENQLPMFARGGGTGRSGESLGEGVMLDFRRHFRGILNIGEASVRVQTGVTLQELQLALTPLGRRIAINPRSWKTATVGGLVATNASGPNVARHGYLRGAVQTMRVVWDNGEADTLHSDDIELSGTRTTEIRTQLTALLAQHRETIQFHRCLTPYNRAGYLLHDVTSGRGSVNLARLLVGTEGTLALTTEVELQTILLPASSTGVILGFRSMAEALRAGLMLHNIKEVCSAEVYDQRLLALTRLRWPVDVPISAELAAVLVVQLETTDTNDLSLVAAGFLQSLRRTFSLICIVGEGGELDTIRFQELSAALETTFESTPPNGARPVPVIEDTAAPCEELVRYVSGVTELLRRSELPGVYRINTLTGQVDIRPVLNPNSDDDRKKLWMLADQVYSLVIAIGGTISSTHGVGLTRTPWLAKQAGPLLPVFRELKQIFDPKQLFNPGKISSVDSSRQAWPLLTTTVAEPAVKPLLIWSDTTTLAEGERCNRCGECRVTTAPTRMCPSFRSQLDDVASPKGQAAFVRLLHSAERGEALANDDLRTVVSHCVNCKMCVGECPSNVNIPKLVLEAKAQIHAEQGLGRDEWVMARLGGMTQKAAWLTTTTNILIRQRPVRWLLEKVLGLSRKRMLPKLASRTFLQRARANGWSKRDKALSADVKIAYFVDTFANFVDPTIGEATVLVLRQLGLPVYVPPRQRGSGVAALSHGDLDSARNQASYNVRVFAELVRDGYTILCSDPTSAITIRQDYPSLFDDEETQLMAQNTHELTDWLGQLMQNGQWNPTFVKPLPYHVGHHVPCHIKATGRTPMGPRLLARIPGLTVTTIDKSCSGMAGTFGLKASAYEASLRIGKPMLDDLRDDAIRFGSTECGSCRMQMQEGSRKRTLHPIQYLAMACGLLPKLEARLHRPLGQLATD
jgi:FAD/FMN-containing dehydrogenase/Fe-S oxidoreductase